MNDFIIDGKQIPCMNDTSCPYTSICYYPFPSTPTKGLCGCNAGWGEIGDRCDQPGTATIYRLIVYSILCGLSFIFTIYIIYELYRLYFIHGNKTLNARSTTLISCMFCLAGMAAYFLLGIHITQHPNEDVDSVQTTIIKKRAYEAERSIALAIMAVFFIAGILNVSLLWLEVAIASKKFKRITSSHLSRRYRIALFLFDFGIGVGTTISIWLGGQSGTIAALGALVIIIM